MVVAAHGSSGRSAGRGATRSSRESVTWFERYGVSSRGIPTTWAEFDAYFQERLDDELVRHRTAAYGVGYATKGWPRPRGCRVRCGGWSGGR